jgi:hypothetical protein
MSKLEALVLLVPTVFTETDYIDVVLCNGRGDIIEARLPRARAIAADAVPVPPARHDLN